jgi:hypothetical protein
LLQVQPLQQAEEKRPVIAVATSGSIHHIWQKISRLVERPPPPGKDPTPPGTIGDHHQAWPLAQQSFCPLLDLGFLGVLFGKVTGHDAYVDQRHQLFQFGAEAVCTAVEGNLDSALAGVLASLETSPPVAPVKM